MEEKEGMFIANGELTDEERKRAYEKFERAAEFVAPGLMESDKSVAEKIEIVWEAISRVASVYFEIIFQNRRIVDLALHHKKERVRKKNLNRITKIALRKIKQGKANG